jgi:hypothetical protein
VESGDGWRADLSAAGFGRVRTGTWVNLRHYSAVHGRAPRVRRLLR